MGVENGGEGGEMGRDAKEPLEELVTDLENQIRQDCGGQDVGEIRAQQGKLWSTTGTQ